MKKTLSYLVMFILATALPVIFNSGYTIQILINILMFAYLASCWNIMGGFGGQFSLGNGVFIGIGAYVTAVLFIDKGISPWIGMLIGGVIAGIISIIIAYPCFKLNGSYYVLATIALLSIFKIIFNQENTMFGFFTGGAAGLKIPWRGGLLNMQFIDKIWYYYIILVLLIMIMLITNLISKTKMGYYLLAINTNQGAAASLGINVMAYKLKAQFISAFFSALGGAYYCMLIMYIDSSRVLGFDMSVQVLLLSVVGGVATVWGPVIGALVLIPLDQILNSLLGSKLSGLSLLIYGLILMLVIYFMPGGLILYLRRFAYRAKAIFTKRKITFKTGG